MYSTCIRYGSDKRRRGDPAHSGQYDGVSTFQKRGNPSAEDGLGGHGEKRDVWICRRKSVTKKIRVA
jgi:hypothetical protein